MNRRSPPIHQRAVTRRRFLTGSVLMLAGAACAPLVSTRPAPAARFTASPFTLGVASGYPGPDRLVLWTRLAPEPLAPGGGMPGEVIPVQWELAADERLRRTVRRGTAYATPEWGHSVHIEPSGLDPDREYWYRFTAGGVQSPAGRSRTAPAPKCTPARLRLAVCCCQMYEHGYYHAYRHMLNDDLDLIVHLGDYIYEYSSGGAKVRSHGAPETYTLDDYRARYALYRLDTDLQAAHAHYPWMLTWDDHEVDNDYADDVSEENDPPALFLARRAAAYQAYYEHLPLPRRALPFGPHMRLYTHWRYGDLAQLCLLDGRQYRSPQACPRPGRRGSTTVSECADLERPERTLLGAAQEAWLFASLKASRARWNLLGQQSIMSHLDEMPGPGRRYWTDSWNGYPQARARLVRYLDEHRIANPVVLGGDIHAFVTARLNAEAKDPDSRVVASEFVTSSISSDGLDQAVVDRWLPENPNLLFANSATRGYLRLELTRDRLGADLVGMQSVRESDASRRLLASYVVEDGRPGPVRA